MNQRLPTHLLVAALLKRMNDSGGFGVVRARGDPHGGGVLAILSEAAGSRIVERGIGPDGRTILLDSTPRDGSDAIESYWQRRRSRDPDLWVIELDGADSERFAAETIASN